MKLYDVFRNYKTLEIHSGTSANKAGITWPVFGRQFDSDKMIFEIPAMSLGYGGDIIYKLLVVDDELFIRNQLSTLIDWQSLGFEAVAFLANETTALNYMSGNHVDVLFTDIRLGSQLGTELSKKARRINSGLEVVLISAYSDFAYARDAISFGAFRYLLKPVTIDEIEQCFIKLREKLDEKNSPVFNEDDCNNILKRLLFNDILMGICISQEDANRRLSVLGMRGFPANQYCAVAELTFSDEPQNNPVVKYGVECVCHKLTSAAEDVLGEGCFFIAQINIRAVISFLLLPLDNASLEKAGNKLREMALSFVSMISMPIMSSVVCGSDGIFTVAAEYRTIRNTYMGQADMIGRIKTHIMSDEPELAAKLLELSVEYFNFNRGKLQSFAEKLLSSVLDSINMTDNLNTLWIDLSRPKSVRDLRLLLSNYIYHLCALISDDSYSKDSVKIAQCYIREHIGEDLSLEKVANYVSLSPTYFSRYFKSCVGERYIDFLTRARIERALELLSVPSNKLSEIYPMVGYNSRSSSLLRQSLVRAMGCTPAEWRESVFRKLGR